MSDDDDAIEDTTQLHEAALADYRRGRTTRAIEAFENILRRKNLDPECELEIRFWLTAALHSVGATSRAREILSRIGREPKHLARHPDWGYRSLTREGLLELEEGESIEKISRLIRHGRALAGKAEDRLESRVLLVRGRLHEACGRRGNAIRCLERGLEARTRTPLPFAVAPYYRALIPLLLHLGRPHDAETHLQRWAACQEPDGFRLPHLPAHQSEWHRARGEFELAYSAAAFAFEAARRIEDVHGRIAATSALCLSALLTGRFDQTRAAIRRLRRLGRMVGPLEQYRVERTCLDGWLGLASVQAAYPILDLEYRRIQSMLPAAEIDASAAAASLDRARFAWDRSQAIGRRLDQTYHTRLRERELGPRRNRLSTLQDSLGTKRVHTHGPRPEARPVPSLPKPRSQRRRRTGLPVEFGTDGGSWYLVLPTRELDHLTAGVHESEHYWFVAHSARPGSGFQLDVWQHGQLVGSARARLVSSDGVERLMLLTNTPERPEWLARLAHFAKSQACLKSIELGDEALAVGCNADADACFATATALCPDRHEGWERRAQSLLARRRPKEAIRACRRALELDSKQPGPWHTLSRAFESQARIQHAREASAQAAARLESGEDEEQEQLEFETK